MVLIEGDIDEIEDTIRAMMEDFWGNIEHQYKAVLTKVQ